MPDAIWNCEFKHIIKLDIRAIGCGAKKDIIDYSAHEDLLDLVQHGNGTIGFLIHSNEH